MKIHSGIEYVRIIALFAVITIHLNGNIFGDYRSVGFFIDELSRFAVPVFFMISGYFWRDGFKSDTINFTVKLFWRVSIPFLFWVVFYLAMEMAVFAYPALYSLTFMNIANLLLVGGPGYHLWFIPALFLGTIISWLAIKYLGERMALLLALSLYAIGVLLATYLGPQKTGIPFPLVRSGFFFSPIFLIAGHMLRKRSPSIPVSLCLIGLGASLQIIEGLYVSGRFPFGHDMSIGTIPYAIGIFGLFLHIRTEKAYFASWGRDVFGAYLMHLFFVKIILARVQGGGIATALLLIAAVGVVSLCISRILKLNRWTRRTVA